MFKKFAFLTTLVTVVAISLFGGNLKAQFQPRGDDNTFSLGRFRIFVRPAYRPLMNGYPGYNPATFRLQSPLLFDRSTVIGRSDNILEGSTPDNSGTLVGIAFPKVISDQSFMVVPPGFEGPNGANEVHTEVVTLDLSDKFGMIHVRAGTAAPGRPISPGEVETNNPPGGTFPARSFFNVNVLATLPAGPNFPGPTDLCNSTPLLIENGNLQSFPPTVVYIHGKTPAVAMFFKNNDPGGKWKAGQVFGYMVLAGHGVNLGPLTNGVVAPGDSAFFDSVYNAAAEMIPPPEAPALTNYGLIVLALLLMATALWLFWKKRTVARGGLA